MTIVEYHSYTTPLKVRGVTVTTNYIDTYPNGDYAPSVRKYSDTFVYSEASNGRSTRHLSRDSERTANYREIVSKGLPLPFNNYSYSKRFDDDWLGSRTETTLPNSERTRTQLHQEGSWNLPQYPRLAEGRVVSGAQGLMSAGEKSRVNDRALAKVISRIRNQKIDLGVAMGEHKQTMRLVAENAVRIAGALASLKRGDFAGAANKFGAGLPTRARRRFDRDFVNRDRPKAISRAWLELQYGWKPLLTDIYGACEQLAEQPRAVYQQCSGSSTYSATITGTYDKSAVQSTTESGHHKYDVKYVIRFATPSATMQDISRLGLLNPATVAWELMPWSFVIDWFLPIGNYLGSFNYGAGLSFMDGSVTTSEEIKSQAVLTLFGQTSSLMYAGVRTKSSYSIQISRTKLFAFPSVPYPSFKNPVSAGHMANALALLVNLRK